ncbi:MAG: NAD(P)-dependent glycerol-3-phosphate dehydrogenase [Candidatus Accumulibacter phosphatis]|uniref:Glycerol-3-phosphate dehydrogenase [NAD(P)+] n=2 Tax=Candidatus Accumulibacter TaxID=327159 RepID=A0A7D5SAC2_9PROT|nr:MULTISPECIES: NAD(P)H-dependent glycerol-3-phosphate dehydrogenase [Candidatus Accumulibacter]QLH48837.1 MAG: NAD(P)-dependent glycerol-3-phosphate dehydrogenase [Candidatus Accumulibacter cognatus]MBL8402546.1 NAD(P)-dependent glycerol-3-phosphate dehydrogenase [Accumulibacter sp.]MBO3709487.1 NAD(P)-dependent glycerol-3-phosphate dehydrogenase [Accumulibacter sp.]MCM8578850.1 NAD(P)-dependent glycerol-3-phosphate dehydrogenase [Accumulibacter sp.]MCQ1547860.1 NAD(P)-dependent glycerol-3-p
MQIAVLGAGAWGTALAISFAHRHSVSLWARDPEKAARMQAAGENSRYLPGHRFPVSLRATADFSAASQNAELMIIAAPLAGLRTALQYLRDAGVATPFLWVCKGLEKGTGLLPHQVVREVLGERLCGVLTGPSFADELARDLPTVVTIASTDANFALRCAEALRGPRLRIYASDDVIGAEVGGAVKNVMAIATGVCDGLGLGMNARAALMTRGLHEIARFGKALGGHADTFMGLSGMGDLFLTCTGDLSRNRRVGLLLATGKPLDQITRELGQVAEGVPAAHEVQRRAAALGVKMPITDWVCTLLDGSVTPIEGVAALMERDIGFEGK